MILIMSTLSRITLIGANLDKPITGCRKCCIRCIYRIFTLALCVVCCGCWPSHTVLDKDEVDYSKYLGSNWKEELKKHEDLK
jgi:hypothetical protein